MNRFERSPAASRAGGRSGSRAHPWAATLIVGVIAAALCGAVRAEFVVKAVRAEFVKQELHVTADLELNLSQQAQLAIDNGVPLVVLTEFELVRDRALWNEVLGSRRNGARLRYHSLSGRYVVEELGRGDVTTHATVSGALRKMGTLRSVVVDARHIREADRRRLMLAVRSRIDIDALPAPLRPLALFSPDWRLSSDWTTWRIAQ